VTAAGWAGAVERLAAARRLLVALDFDGTLAPLVADPDLSRMAPGAASALARLSLIGRVQLALVSGRPAADLARLAQPPGGTLLVGSHGAERGRMAGGRAALEPVALSPARADRLKAISSGLARLAASAPGAWVEAKPFAAVFHTRPMANRDAAARLQARAAELGRDLGGHVLPGKMVVEVSVLPAGKAAALARLKRAVQADRLVFAGDDTTDELALRQIRPPDLGIKVGLGRTAAELRLPDPPAVVRFLDHLATALAA
jgi:trehalose 6-phosphate phosphatase